MCVTTSGIRYTRGTNRKPTVGSLTPPVAIGPARDHAEKVINDNVSTAASRYICTCKIIIAIAIIKSNAVC